MAKVYHLTCRQFVIAMILLALAISVVAREPFDLSQSDDEIVEWTKRAFGDDPTFKPVEEWRAEFAQRLS